MAARGRPRKLGVPRNPTTGRIASGYDRQSPEAIQSVAIEARIRQLLGVDEWRAANRNEKNMEAARKRVSSPLLGDDPLGRLLFSRQISQDQYDSAMWFRKLMGNLARIDKAPSMMPKGFLSGMVPSNGSISVYEEDTQEWIDDNRKKLRRVMGYVMACPASGGVFAVLNWAIRENRMPDPDEMGNLRVGLNAIAKARGT